MAGAELRRLRELAGQSQLDLQAATGISQSRISLAETGRTTLTAEEAKRVARVVLDVMKRKMSEVEAAVAQIEAAA